MIWRGRFLDVFFLSMFANLGSFENFSAVIEKCFQKIDSFPFEFPETRFSWPYLLPKNNCYFFLVLSYYSLAVKVSN